MSRRSWLPRACLLICLGLFALTPLIRAPAAATPKPAAMQSNRQGLKARSGPRTNTSPSRAFIRRCHRVTDAQRSQERCERVALRSFDRVRAKEGLGPMSLPGDFARLTTPQQILVITNIERVDRGLRPAVGLSPQLDGYARSGARADEDPPFPMQPHGTSATSSWAGTGTSALLADYVWMYDDGPGSINVDCRRAGDSGCWAHRHNVLSHYGRPLKLGAAFQHDHTYGGSIGAEWTGGDERDSLLMPTWSQIAGDISVGVSPRRVNLGRRHSSRRLLAWASGRSMDVHFKVVSNAAQWNVTRKTCRLPAGHSCSLRLTFSHKRRPGHSGLLKIFGNGGIRYVGLHV